jgi:hypothetical protein
MLPFHRRERPETSTATEKTPRQDSLFQELVRFVIDWIKVSWKDVIAMAILGGATLGVSRRPTFSCNLQQPTAVKVF